MTVDDLAFLNNLDLLEDHWSTAVVRALTQRPESKQPHHAMIGATKWRVSNSVKAGTAEQHDLEASVAYVGGRPPGLSTQLCNLELQVLIAFSFCHACSLVPGTGDLAREFVESLTGRGKAFGRGFNRAVFRLPPPEQSAARLVSYAAVVDHLRPGDKRLLHSIGSRFADHCLLDSRIPSEDDHKSLTLIGAQVFGSNLALYASTLSVIELTDS